MYFSCFFFLSLPLHFFPIFPPITVELDSEHAQKVPEAESGQQQVKLKDRQKFFEEAFQQDMEHYLSTSYLQIAERRGEPNIQRKCSEGGGS